MVTISTAAAVSAEAQLRRREIADESIHSLAMEGLTVSDWQLANIEEFVAGAIEIDELIARGRAPYIRD